MDLSIVPAQIGHSEVLCRVLNEIVEIGGTTAIEELLVPTQFSEWFITGSSVVSCAVATLATGEPVAFQSLSTHFVTEPEWVDIGTFAKPGLQTRGAGRLMFDYSRALARSRGFKFINAQIRADNLGGLAFYTKLGFVDYDVKRGVPLKDGTPMDRICKRYDLT